MKDCDYRRHQRLIDCVLKWRIPLLSSQLSAKLYDEAYYAEGNEWKVASCKKVAEVLNEFLGFYSVFDIGCGVGLYIEQLHRLGKEVLGCDASAAAIGMAPMSISVFQADATRPIKLNRRFDLVLCFEVAEHIQGRYSSQLVRNCVQQGDVVCFTAAPQGQGGIGHINEQPYHFWIDLFRRQGLRYEDALSEQIRTRMKAEQVVSWIAENLMVFNSKASVAADTTIPTRVRI